MKKLSCKDLSLDFECDFTANGGDGAELVDKMFAHLQSDHPEEMGDMPEEDRGKLMKKMLSKVK
ncbi:hypothetical protein CL634_07560 [bacterium]|nr:hypothetical protein [bacterium]|tara:strand:+ start:742 stop:933 length:192 start_codon:yes stop_codon:yes gene_type:complete